MNKKIIVEDKSETTIYPYMYEHNIKAMAKMDKLFFEYKCQDNNNMLFVIAPPLPPLENDLPF